MIDYVGIVANIKAKFTKTQEKDFNQIVEFDSLKLASMGHNDTEGYQIFTPKFIVKDMCAAIGDDVFDFTKNILEPTSGDGAFVVYILNKRLEKALKDGNYEVNSLRALSTIYSVEMDKELMIKQRSNIFTLMKQFPVKHNIVLPNDYYELVKCMILNNFIWGMFNAEHSVDNLWGAEVIYKMPEAEKNNYKPLDMPVWTINNDLVEVKYEGVDL